MSAQDELNVPTVTATVTEQPAEGDKKAPSVLGSFRKKLSRTKSRQGKDLGDGSTVSELEKALLKIEAQDEALKTLKAELLDACSKNKTVFVDLEESIKNATELSVANEAITANMKVVEDEKAALKQELNVAEERLQLETKKSEGLQSMAVELEKAHEEIQALTAQNELLRKEVDGLKKSLGRANSLFSWFGKTPAKKEKTTKRMSSEGSSSGKFITQTQWQMRYYGVVYDQ